MSISEKKQGDLVDHRLATGLQHALAIEKADGNLGCIGKSMANR